MDDNLFISIEECAKIFGVGRNTMLRMVKFPKFPAIVLKGKILILKSKIPIWIENHLGYVEK